MTLHEEREWQEWDANSYEIARNLIGFALAQARGATDTNVLGLVQNALYYAHFEVTEELDEMREELLELGFTPEELDAKDEEEDDEEDGDEEGEPVINCAMPRCAVGQPMLTN